MKALLSVEKHGIDLPDVRSNVCLIVNEVGGQATKPANGQGHCPEQPSLLDAVRVEVYPKGTLLALTPLQHRNSLSHQLLVDGWKVWKSDTRRLFEGNESKVLAAKAEATSVNAVELNKCTERRIKANGRELVTSTECN